MCNFLVLLVELLNEEEFGENSETTTYDENAANPAVELGLMVGNLKIKDQIVFRSLILYFTFKGWFPGGKSGREYVLSSVSTNYAYSKAISHCRWPGGN